MYHLTNERYKTYQLYQTGFSFGHLGHTQSWDLWVPCVCVCGGGGGGGVGIDNFFFEIQPDLVCGLLT